MDNKPFVISIPHNATRFTKQLFDCDHWHIYGRESHKEKLYQKCAEHKDSIIVPLRHPRNVLISWEKRGRNILEFLGAYHDLHELDKHFSLLYLPVDHPRREYFLDHILNHFGLPRIDVDWDNLVGFQKTYDSFRPSGRNIDVVYQLDPIKQLYEDKI